MSVLEMEPGLGTMVSGGPMEGPDAEPGMQPAMVIDLMGEGSVIEKNPTPVASIIASQPAAEAILQRMFGPSPEEGDEHAQPGERFTPYQLTGDPAEIFGGITVIGQDPESLASANAFVRRLLGSIQRPEDEAATTPETVITKDDQADPESGLGRNLLGAFRRSRLAKAVSAGALVVSGALSWASSASASSEQNMISTTPGVEASSVPFAALGTQYEYSGNVATASDDSLAQQCIQAGLITPEVLVAKMYAAGRPAQTVKGIFHEDAMPDGCAGQYDRYLSLRFLLQNAEHRKRWTYLDPGEISTWEKGGELLDGAFTSGPAITQNVHNKKDDYQCSPQKSHKYDTQVKGQTKNIVEDANGHVVGGPVISTFKVKVYFPC